jgi:16S rRNA (uracil1498-N3)-methyltransferase
MGHVPHLYMPRPWAENEIELTPSQLHHLQRVLRVHDGEHLSYTDGEGVLGTGVLEQEKVTRGTEAQTLRLPHLELAVAPPHERDRIRWLVEKAGELQVSRIRWLETRFGTARPAMLRRAQDWAIAALEQSRGAWLTRVDNELTVPESFDDGLPTVVANRDGDPATQTLPLRVLIGPEGGWAPGEVDGLGPTISLGNSVLRVETAALAAAVVFRVKPLSN